MCAALLIAQLRRPYLAYFLKYCPIATKHLINIHDVTPPLTHCTRIRLPLAATMAERGIDLSVMLAICSENGRALHMNNHIVLYMHTDTQVHTRAHEQSHCIAHYKKEERKEKEIHTYMYIHTHVHVHVSLRSGNGGYKIIRGTQA